MEDIDSTCDLDQFIEIAAAADNEHRRLPEWPDDGNRLGSACGCAHSIECTLHRISDLSRAFSGAHRRAKSRAKRHELRDVIDAQCDRANSCVLEGQRCGAVFRRCIQDHERRFCAQHGFDVGTNAISQLGDLLCVGRKLIPSAAPNESRLGTDRENDFRGRGVQRYHSRCELCIGRQGCAKVVGISLRNRCRKRLRRRAAVVWHTVGSAVYTATARHDNRERNYAAHCLIAS